tara:strand:- start:269 stop:2257 length:1989 start_codon:yes stop_codon:yes gene_type:complete
MGFTLYSSGNASSFWLGDDFDNDFKTDHGVDYTKLASTQRAIGNFVNIVTGKNIPVKFQSGGDSYTDGKSVVIGTKLEGKDFDPAVGLALHEGSHIAFTDFKLLRKFSSNLRLQGLDPECNMSMHHEQIIKDLLNWIEDRRIDFLIYTNAPGYRMYYESMYNKYFNDKAIDKALRDGRKRNETIEDYFFHIINFTNPNRDLTQLELLEDIWNLIDLKNISRLESTQDAFVVACDIYKLLKPQLDKQEEAQELQDAIDKQKDFLNGKTDNSEDGLPEAPGTDEPDVGDAGGVDNVIAGTSQTSDDDDDDDDGGADDGAPELSSRQQKILDNAIQQQRDFLNGEQKKTGRLTKAQSYTVKALHESGTEVVMVDLGRDVVETIVIKKLTKNVIEHMPSLFTTYNNNDHVLKGIRLGKILGKKLQVRNDARTLKSTRLETGKIDRRLISQLGYNNVNVFHKIITDRFKDHFIHVSIDASGSMNGDKFYNSITSAVAIAQAASMTTGIRVQISLRGTSNIGKSSNSGPRCTTIVAYDSKTDKMSKIRSLFQYLDLFGMTPEGVAFKSIEKQIIQDANGCECVFINYSDGFPTSMGTYATTPADYTRLVMKQFREQGISILSYFITSSDYFDLTKFKLMYGNDAEHINPENMLQVARTMNSKFLEKSK